MTDVKRIFRENESSGASSIQKIHPYLIFFITFEPLNYAIVMEKFGSTNEILDFAIQQEQNAVDFYTSLSENAANQEMKAVFAQFALEEMGHKARLLTVKETGLFERNTLIVPDLKIADYVVRGEQSPNMSYEEALVLAMKREKAAFKLYTHLADRAGNDEIRNLFQSLAIEESKHKLRFEIEYDEFVLREN